MTTAALPSAASTHNMPLYRSLSVPENPPDLGQQASAMAITAHRRSISVPHIQPLKGIDNVAPIRTTHRHYEHVLQTQRYARMMDRFQLRRVTFPRSPTSVSRTRSSTRFASSIHEPHSVPTPDDSHSTGDGHRDGIDGKPKLLATNLSRQATRHNSVTGLAFQCTVESQNSAYALGACDLGDTRRLDALLKIADIDYAAPTLVLAECVVSYLDPAAGTTLLQWLSSSFTDATAVLYDPLALNDAFGETLQRYFAVKGCELLSLREFQTPMDHCNRLLRRCEWKSCHIVDMNAVFDAATTSEEKKRVQALEAFDEYADWVICNAHYGIFLATTQVVSQTHWSRQFCATRGFMAQWIDDEHTILRTFQPNDLKPVQKLFQTTHLDYACKAVTKFVNNRVRSGDLADIEASFMYPQSHFWVIDTTDGVIIGCVGLKAHASANTAELCRLSVAKTARRRGLASRLVATLEAFAIESGYDAIHLDTIESMEAAQAFYRAKGYTEAAERAKYSTFTLVSFAKALK